MRPLLKLITSLATLSFLLILLVSCGKPENQNGKNTFDNNELSAETCEMFQEGGSSSSICDDNNSIEYISEVDWLFSEEGLDLRIAANKVALAYLRGDEDELLKHLSDECYDTVLSEGLENRIEKLEYMVLDLQDNTIMGKDSVSYPVTFQIKFKNAEMLVYLDIDLEKINGEYQVSYICLQG